MTSVVERPQYGEKQLFTFHDSHPPASAYVQLPCCQRLPLMDVKVSNKTMMPAPPHATCGTSSIHRDHHECQVACHISARSANAKAYVSGAPCCRRGSSVCAGCSGRVAAAAPATRRSPASAAARRRRVRPATCDKPPQTCAYHYLILLYICHRHIHTPCLVRL